MGRLWAPADRKTPPQLYLSALQATCYLLDVHFMNGSISRDTLSQLVVLEFLNRYLSSSIMFPQARAGTAHLLPVTS